MRMRPAEEQVPDLVGRGSAKETVLTCAGTNGGLANAVRQHRRNDTGHVRVAHDVAFDTGGCEADSEDQFAVRRRQAASRIDDVASPGPTATQPPDDGDTGPAQDAGRLVQRAALFGGCRSCGVVDADRHTDPGGPAPEYPARGANPVGPTAEPRSGSLRRPRTAGATGRQAGGGVHAELAGLSVFDRETAGSRVQRHVGRCSARGGGIRPGERRRDDECVIHHAAIVGSGDI